MIRILFLLLAVPLPNWLKRTYYRRLFGWKVGVGVRIGCSFIDATHVNLGDGVTIGHLNLIRNVRHLTIGNDCYIANGNHFCGARSNPQFESRLKIGAFAQFMSHHFVDVAGDVTIGDRVTIGGRSSQIWSHSLLPKGTGFDLRSSSVVISDDVYVGARVTLVCCEIPAGALVGAGSVVTRSYPSEESRILIAGNPAVIRKRYPRDGALSDPAAVAREQSSIEADILSAAR